jgi:magnesium-transporting ATPase (P-type)
MILQDTSLWDWFPKSSGWLILMIGLIAITWMGYERKRQGGFIAPTKEGWQREVDLPSVLRGLSYIGIVVGAISIWAGFVSLFGNIPPSYAYAANYPTGPHSGNNYFTVGMLIVLGMVCVLKPLGDLPWASLVGLIAGVALGILSLSFIPVAVLASAFSISVAWIYIIVILIIGSVVGLLFRFWTKGITGLAKILSYPPIALVVAIACFVQAYMLLALGQSIVV